MHSLWFYKHQHDNRVRSKLFVARQLWWFQWRFAAILVNCARSGEMHNYCTPHIMKENFENFLIHRCNYILLSQVYCVWQVVKTRTIILNNPVYHKWVSSRIVVGMLQIVFKFNLLVLHRSRHAKWVFGPVYLCQWILRNYSSQINLQ